MHLVYIDDSKDPGAGLLLGDTDPCRWLARRPRPSDRPQTAALGVGSNLHSQGAACYRLCRRSGAHFTKVRHTTDSLCGIKYISANLLGIIRDLPLGFDRNSTER